MTLYNEINIKSILLILLCLIILSILFCIVTSKFREGLDNIIGLQDFTHSDPNIRPTPLPDICIGNGNFISQPNSTIPVTATAGYLHSNIGACENECTPERGCFAVSFDRASKDVMKKCNIYSGATSAGENTTKAGLLCSRISPTCSVDSYKLNNTSSDLATVIKPNGGEYFTHSNEGYCAVECNNRANCIGYLYDNKSKDYLKPCRIFSKNKNGLSTGFPVAGICSRSLVSASYFNGTWQIMPCPEWSASVTNKKVVFKVDGNKVEMTPLDPTVLSVYGKGNAIIDGDGMSGSWANGTKFSGVLKGNKIYWDKNCFYEKISSSTNIPQWHLAPVGSTTCDSGTNASSGECEAIVKSLATKNKRVPGRSMQFASGFELLEPCNDSAWGSVPIGCSAQTGGDWAAHYKTGGVNCNRGYQLVCSGKAPPDSSAPSPGSPPPPPGTPPPLSNPALWGQVIKNSNYGGYDLGSATAKPILSLDHCLKQCEDTPGCVEVVHGTAYGRQNNCYMKCRPEWHASGSAPGMDVHVMKDANKRAVPINSKNSC